MSTALSIAGILAGIGLFLATIYALARAVALDGEGRILHGLTAGLALALIAALWMHETALARMLSVALFLVAGRTLMLERRWFRVMPGLLIGFAILLMLGYVQLT